jgi:hypothetical protein
VSRYGWPKTPARGERGDDPGSRAAWVARRRGRLGLEAALLASRASPRPSGPHAGFPRAPISGSQYLWQPLGPVTLLGGQAEGNPRVAGRVNALAVHPLGERLYAASANGGVWYSKDGGASWTSVGGLAATNTAGILRPAQRNACGAILVDWGSGEGDDTVYVGTGEVTHAMNAEFPSSEGGLGIFVGDKPTKSANPDPWVREARNLVNTGVYKIAKDPTGSTIVAATRIGLWQRPPGGGVDVNWVRPAGTPFNSLDTDCTDLLWTDAVGGAPARLWVWVQDGPNFGLWVRDNGTDNFAKVALDGAAAYGYTAARASLAASTPQNQVWVLNDRGSSTLPALFRVTNPAPPAHPIAHSVVGVPNVLRDQGFYDICLAVDPANANRVALAGSWLMGYTKDGPLVDYNASIVVGDVAADPANGNKLTYGHPTAWTHIGVGAHPDVHAVEYSNGGARLWCGCDGGVFRSDRPTGPAGFYPRNDGFSISESNFVAGHPRCEGNVVVGLQDNGVVERLSTGVWREVYEGDGGGVAMNPLNPTQYVAQYIQGDWYNAPGPGTGPLVRAGTLVSAESSNAAFYSMPACIAHVRTPPAPAAAVPISQTLIGTQRPWYSDDFGATWVTLPAGSDPLPGDTSVQDDLGGAINVCRWQSPDVAWLLFEQRIVRLSRTPGSHNGGGAGTWAAPEDVAPPGYHPTGKAKKRPPAPPSLLDAAVWTDIAPNLDAGGAQRGTKGALYIGTIGHETKTDVDTLWWFDGTDQWYATQLRAAVPAPVLAIACDPTTPDEVWVGTTVGVWHGQRTFPTPTTPHWDWTQRVNGLPEAACEDLQIFRDGSLVLLRAAIAARGIWELRLDATDVPDLTYLRAHDDDLRHRVGGPPATPLRATEVRRDLSTTVLRSWHGSPDVRPREAPRAIAAPASLPWRRDHRPANTDEILRRFQAAMRSHTGDPRIVANGKWDVYFSEILRDHGAPTVHVAAAPPAPALDKVQITTAFWNSHMTGAHATAAPWGAGLPSEADLFQLTPTLAEGVVGQASCALPRRPLEVDIIVHHRGANPIDGANVRVTLLRWTKRRRPHDAHWDDPTTWPTGNVPWTGAVNQVLNSADGKTALALGADWQFVLGTSAGDSRRLDLAGQTLDMMRAGVVTFDFPTSLLATPAANSVVLLVAVLRTGADIALAPASLRDLTLVNPSVAVRSMRIT